MTDGPKISTGSEGTSTRPDPELGAPVVTTDTPNALLLNSPQDQYFPVETTIAPPGHFPFPSSNLRPLRNYTEPQIRTIDPTHERIEDLRPCVLESTPEESFEQMRRIVWGTKTQGRRSIHYALFLEPGEAIPEFYGNLPNTKGDEADSSLLELQLSYDDFVTNIQGSTTYLMQGDGEPIPHTKSAEIQYSLCRSQSADKHGNYGIWIYQYNLYLENFGNALTAKAHRALPHPEKPGETLELTDAEITRIVHTAKMDRNLFSLSKDFPDVLSVIKDVATCDQFAMAIEKKSKLPNAKLIADAFRLAVQQERTSLDNESSAESYRNFHVGATSLGILTNVLVLLIFNEMRKMTATNTKAITASVAAMEQFQQKSKIEDLGKDLVAEAKARIKLNPKYAVIGRMEEAKLVMQALARGDNANASLVGLTGVGKKEVMRTVAWLMATNHESVPPELRGKELWMADPQRMLAGTQNRGAFSENLSPFRQKMAEGHPVYFAEAARGADAGSVTGSNAEAWKVMMLEVLGSEESRAIIDAQPHTFQELIEGLRDLERRVGLDPIEVNHLHPELIKKAMVEQVRLLVAAQKGVTITPAAAEAAVRLGIVYRQDSTTALFDPAKKALEDAVNFAREEAGYASKTKVEVTEKHVAQAMERTKGIKINPDAGKNVFEPVSRPHSRVPWVPHEERTPTSRGGNNELISRAELLDVISRTKYGQKLAKTENGPALLEKLADHVERRLARANPSYQETILASRRNLQVWTEDATRKLRISRNKIRAAFIQTSYGKRLSSRRPDLLEKALDRLEKDLYRSKPSLRDGLLANPKKMRAWTETHYKAIRNRARARKSPGMGSVGRRKAQGTRTQRRPASPRPSVFSSK